MNNIIKLKMKLSGKSQITMKDKRNEELRRIMTKTSDESGGGRVTVGGGLKVNRFVNSAN